MTSPRPDVARPPRPLAARAGEAASAQALASPLHRARCSGQPGESPQTTRAPLRPCIDVQLAVSHLAALIAAHELQRVLVPPTTSATWPRQSPRDPPRPPGEGDDVAGTNLARRPGPLGEAASLHEFGPVCGFDYPLPALGHPLDQGAGSARARRPTPLRIIDHRNDVVVSRGRGRQQLDAEPEPAVRDGDQDPRNLSKSF
jgi:hypothetical protein